jgi:hypothetical protein
MGLVPDTYIFTKTANGNVELTGLKNSAVVELYSLSPDKDIRISQSYPESIVIPVDSIGNHVDNKFVAIPWEKIDFSASNPVVSPLPSTIFEAVQALGADFFFELGGGGSCPEGTNYIYVCAKGTPIENAAELQAAYITAQGMAPSVTNRITIVASPGYYDFETTTFVMDTDFIDLVSLDGNRSVIFNSVSPDGRILITADNVFVKGVDLESKRFEIANNLSKLRIENCAGGSQSFGNTVEVSGTFIDCSAAELSFGGDGGTASGIFINCQAAEASFGGSNGGMASGVFTNCIGGQGSFGAYGTADGTFTNCQGGDESFGVLGTASGVFTNCQGGKGSFGGDNGTASGVFTNCKGDFASFGGGLSGTASGVFIECDGGDISFAGDGGTASGEFTRCNGGFDSFGTYGTANGTFTDCKSLAGGFGAFGAASGIFLRCTAGDLSFGSGFAAAASGTFIDCVGGILSFGAVGVASGVFTNCKADYWSFGGSPTDGAASGVFNYCVAGDSSFGGVSLGFLTGKLYFCRLTSGTFLTPTGGGSITLGIDGSNNVITI